MARAARASGLSLLACALGAAAPSPGALLGAFPCDASDALQRLIVSAADATVRTPDGALCVALAGASPAPLELRACDGGAAQRWAFDAATSSFRGADSAGNCLAWNSQGTPGLPQRSLSTWECTSLQWNGFFSPAPPRIVANCSAPGDCDGALCVSAVGSSYAYELSDARGPARVFDGIGGLSGGGAVSRLLPSYDAETRGAIMDLLFLPQFAASLQVLKVEIGSECQATDGAEASHRRASPDTPGGFSDSFERGYEWLVMKEAKRRNPGIKLYGLAWGWPQYLSCAYGTLENCTNDPYTNRSALVDYVVSWVRGARDVHGLIIDYVSDWNERPEDDTYLVMLRAGLDAAGLHTTRVVGADTDWAFASNVLHNPALAASIDAVAAHYPGGHSSADALKTGLPLWASEEISTFNNRVAAGCLARCANQGFVGGQITSTIVWNLISAYVKGTNWYRAGMLNAMHPWAASFGTFNFDGSWSTGPMLWAAAHTTQFTRADGSFFYLFTDDAGDGSPSGSGFLKLGGSYVTLKDFSSGDFTVVVEKMSSVHSQCVRPGLDPFVTAPETITFRLGGSLASGAPASLFAWRTHFSFDDGDAEPAAEFERMPDVTLTNNSFSFNLTVDSLWTFTTVAGGRKGAPPSVPPRPAFFPTQYANSFDACVPPQEADFVLDQSGAFECVDSGDPAHGVVMRAMTPLKPIPSGGDFLPYSLVGSRDAQNLSLTFDFKIARDGESVMAGVRIQNGANAGDAGWFCVGLFVVINASSSPPSTAAPSSAAQWAVYASVMDVAAGAPPLARGACSVPVGPGGFHRLRVDANGSSLRVWVDGAPQPLGPGDALDIAPTGLFSGHALVGAAAYGHYTELDNLALASAYSACGSGGAAALAAGARVTLVPCGSELGGPRPGTAWRLDAGGAPAATVMNGSLVIRAAPGLCLRAGAAASASLAACDAGDALQRFVLSFEGADPDGERQSTVATADGARCLTSTAGAESGTEAVLAKCDGSDGQQVFLDYESGELTNEAGTSVADAGPGGRRSRERHAS